MEKKHPASIYVSAQLKKRLVAAARANGYAVGSGRRSGLAKFIDAMLQDHELHSQDDSVLLPLSRLTPELRSLVARLSEMGTSRQNQASAILEILADDWQG